MKDISLASLKGKAHEYGQGLAYKLACEQAAQIDDIGQQYRNSGASCQAVGSKKIVTLEYLNQTYQITLPDVEISLKDGEGNISQRDKILILHYLTRAKGTPPSNKTITYKELPEGTIYFPTFTKRAIQPLLGHFGSEPARLADAAGIFGGRRAEYGDIAVTIDAFTKVPITLVLWQGDEELPPSGSVLFDRSITDYLSTEDITVLCETIAWRLVKSYRQL